MSKNLYQDLIDNADPSMGGGISQDSLVSYFYNQTQILMGNIEVSDEEYNLSNAANNARFCAKCLGDAGMSSKLVSTWNSIGDALSEMDIKLKNNLVDFNSKVTDYYNKHYTIEGQMIDAANKMDQLLSSLHISGGSTNQSVPSVDSNVSGLDELNISGEASNSLNANATNDQLEIEDWGSTKITTNTHDFDAQKDGD